MNKGFLLLGFLMLVFCGSASASFSVADSIGVESKNGKLFVVHKVEPKETLYALSRKYKVTVAQIVEANPKVETTIEIGQLIYIPRPNMSKETAKALMAQANRTFTVDQRGAKIHKVEPKQTLFGISRMYNVTVDDLKKWNKLQTDHVKIGESLIVGYGGKATQNPMYVPEADDAVGMVKNTTVVKAPENAVATAAKTESAANVKKDEPKTFTESADDRIIEKAPVNTSISKVVENGMAEVIDQKADTNKFLALHKSAPVGTILQVKNIMNNQTVYVRVIGKLPETGSNDKVVVKLSKRAYQRLGALDNRFRVEVSYMP